MPCEVFVDTMGVGFAYPFVKLFFHCKIFAYTHYPIVTNDLVGAAKTTGKVQVNGKDADSGT